MTMIDGVTFFGDDFIQFSEPVRNPDDGYYYQQYRFLDSFGNVTGYGNRQLKSWAPNSKLVLVERAIDGTKLAMAMAGLVTTGMNLTGGSLLGMALRFTPAMRNVYEKGVLVD